MKNDKVCNFDCLMPPSRKRDNIFVLGDNEAFDLYSSLDAGYNVFETKLTKGMLKEYDLTCHVLYFYIPNGGWEKEFYFLRNSSYCDSPAYKINSRASEKFVIAPDDEVIGKIIFRFSKRYLRTGLHYTVKIDRQYMTTKGGHKMTTQMNDTKMSTFDQNSIRLYVHVQKLLAKEDNTDWISVVRKIAEENDRDYKSVRLFYIRGHRLIYGDKPVS